MCLTCGTPLKKINQNYVCIGCKNTFKKVRGYLVQQIPVGQILLPKVYDIAMLEGQARLKLKIGRLKNWINDVAEKKTDFVYNSAGRQYFKTDVIRIRTKELTKLERAHRGYIDQGGHVWPTKPKEPDLVKLWGARFAKRSFVQLRYALQSKFRNKIFERDNNKCQVCGSTERLELAHIIPVTVVIDCGLPMKAAFVDENLGTLCRDCHKKQHSRHFDQNVMGYAKAREMSAKKAILHFAEGEIGIAPKAVTL